MKRITVISIAMCFGIMSYAQEVKNRDFKTKLKYAKKEGKELESDGWYVSPGSFPIEKQLEITYTKQLEQDDDGYPKYIIASGNSVAGMKSAAKMQATELAKLELASQLSSQISATIDNQIANNQLSATEAATLQKTVANSKNVVVANMGRSITLFEIYKDIRKTKNIECQVRLAYSLDMAKQMYIDAMKADLEEDAAISLEKFDKIFSK